MSPAVPTPLLMRLTSSSCFFRELFSLGPKLHLGTNYWTCRGLPALCVHPRGQRRPGRPQPQSSLPDLLSVPSLTLRRSSGLCFCCGFSRFIWLLALFLVAFCARFCCCFSFCCSLSSSTVSLPPVSPLCVPLPHPLRCPLPLPTSPLHLLIPNTPSVLGQCV